MSKDELILCVPTSYLRQNGLKDGFVTGKDADTLLSAITDDGITCYRVRSYAEKNRYFKQVIPYIVLRHGDEVFSYPRDGGEDRLHGKWSIGLGGHVNADDYAATQGKIAAYLGAAAREFCEEAGVAFSPQDTLQVQGIVNEDETDVGMVHVGVVMFCDMADKLSVLIDNEITGGRWTPVKELYLDRYARMEPWSKYVLQNLYASSLVKAVAGR